MELRDLILKNYNEAEALDLVECEETLIDLFENDPGNDEAFLELKDVTFRKNQERQTAFLEQYEKRLAELLSECGLYNTDVFYEGARGRIKIETGRHTKIVCFCPYKKDGTLSKVLREVPILGIGLICRSDEQIKNELKNTFTPAAEVGLEEHEEEYLV